ncbi:MAG: hypothetical protein SFY56_14690 [Bacteroidota bacterium]|nr:hypothetical protein [Bacteroidota bacterium]
MINRLLLTFLILASFLSNGQTPDSLGNVFKQVENELKMLQNVVFFSKKESDRIAGNKKFITTWDKIITNSACINYPFDSLKEVSVLTPKDKKFKLITWDFPREDGTHAFFGYLLVNNSKRIKKGLFKHETINEYEYFKLIDNSPLIKNPETFVGTTDKWFGMLYLTVIECDGFYTLIGYDPNDKLTRKKFIDVLYFKSDGTPIFGKDVFKFARKNPKRLQFEYSSQVSMSVRYNEKQNKIIYSHLAPNREGDLLEGQFQFYGPDGSFDALELKKDKWVTVEDVDARNEKNKNDKAEKPDPKKENPIFKPK